MTLRTRVALVGASGETGKSISDALLDLPDKFELLALARPSSIDKLAFSKLKERGGKVVPIDLDGAVHEIAAVLKGTDVLIACTFPTAVKQQIALADAAKIAGVTRFVPSFWATPSPPGVMLARDLKEEVLNHIKRIYLPYTVIDVGWWFQNSLPKLPSGKTDSVGPMPMQVIPADGNVLMGLTDLRDIGYFTARIISDPNTVNKHVFAFSEVLTWNDIFVLAENVSGEKIPRNYLPGQDIDNQRKAARTELDKNISADNLRNGSLSLETGTPALFAAMGSEYMYSWGVRGDNNPASAGYLGYLDAKKLYPEVKCKSFKEFLQETIEGKVASIYAGRFPSG